MCPEDSGSPTSTPPPKPTVFVSYSHNEQDEMWKNRLMPHLRALEQADRIIVWDDRKIDPGGKWAEEIREVMARAAIAVCLISADYLASDFCQKEEVRTLIKRNERDGIHLIFLLIRPCTWQAHSWLKERQMLPRDGKAVATDFKDTWDIPFTELANFIFRIIDDPHYVQPAIPSLWQKPERLDISRLPTTGDELFGRQQELALLDEAWESETTKVVSLVAWGGVGKSTLVNKWLERMGEDNYRGAKRVFGWSFYSRSSSDQNASADLFIAKALEWFGDENPADGSPWVKGKRLANLIRQQKTLLVLDGLEPLQSTYEFERGKIKDPALAVLLRELAKNNSGLCLVTTREPLTDLQRYQDAVLEKDLEQISPEAGRALLRVAGIRGSDAELEAASCAFGNHALALNLLAAYLVGFTDQHIRNAAAIPDLDIPEQEGRHARRLMAALAQRLGDGPELNILRIMGLFEGPVTPAEIRCFRRQSPIKGLSDRLLFIKEDLWQQTLATLRSNRLLAPASRHAPEMLDAHPFVRDHFGREFGQFNPAAWQEAHSRLYEFYKKQAPDLPETLEEMEPLFAAVAHGCKADRHKDALEEIYIRRIQRDCSIDFCCTQLGAFNADLAALRNFFTAPWNRLPPTEPYKAFTIATLGFRLQGIGLFREAIKPMQTGFKAAITNNDWSNAARAAGNLSRIHSALGDLPQADIIAHEGVKLADRSKSSNERRDNRIILATVLLQKGQFAKATNLFSKAEAMQRIKMPQRLLFSVQGYNYCDLLLIQGKAEEVLVRTKQSLQMTTLYQAPLFIGLDHLNLGRSFLMLAEEEKANNVTEAAHHLNEAVDRLRQAGQIDFLPLALLAQAQLHRFTGEFDKAQQDLEEVFEIAEPEMRLHLTDYHLESARLALAMGDPANAQPHYLAAKDLISATGYHRRDKELADIRKQLAIA